MSDKTKETIAKLRVVYAVATAHPGLTVEAIKEYQEANQTIHTALPKLLDAVEWVMSKLDACEEFADEIEADDLRSIITDALAGLAGLEGGNE